MIDWNMVIQITIGVILSIGAYLYNSLKNDTKDVKIKADKTLEELMNYKLYVAEKFVSVDHLTVTMENVHRTLETMAAGVLRVEARLNNQIDNSNARNSNSNSSN